MKRALSSAVTLVVLGGCAGDVGESGEMARAVSDPLDSVFEDLRARTERFQDVDVALAEGYVRDPSGMCVTAAFEGFPSQLGAMGIHYFRPDLLGLTGDTPRVNGVGMHTDFDEPAVLVYFPTEDGSLQLGAIENLVWEKAWHDAGNDAPPSFHGLEYWHMVDNPVTADVDEAHGFAPHYELHLWVHEQNPLGTWIPHNPAVTCEHHEMAAGE